MCRMTPRSLISGIAAGTVLMLMIAPADLAMATAVAPATAAAPHVTSAGSARALSGGDVRVDMPNDLGGGATTVRAYAWPAGFKVHRGETIAPLLLTTKTVSGGQTENIHVPMTKAAKRLAKRNGGVLNVEVVVSGSKQQRSSMTAFHTRRLADGHVVFGAAAMRPMTFAGPATPTAPADTYPYHCSYKVTH